MSDKKYWTSFNYVEFELPHDAVVECSHAGRCDDDVEYWQRELKLGLDRDKMIKELKEYGAWSESSLKDMDNDDLEQKLIWLAAGDIREEIRK